MGLWTFLAIIIVTGILVDGYNKHQKTKLRLRGNDQHISELEEEIKTLTRRIENLEIIAVSEPDNFSDRTSKSSGRAQESYSDPASNNQRLVNELARRKRGEFS